MTLRTKLKDSQMRLVELASYLNVSRPTLYKYLELYEAKEYDQIDKKCFDLFSFIDNTRSIKRPTIMDYLINKIIPIEYESGTDVEIISSVRKLSGSVNKTDLKKMEIIRALSATNKFDDVIDILVEMSKGKSKITEDNIQRIISKGEKENGWKEIENS